MTTARKERRSSKIYSTFTNLAIEDVFKILGGFSRYQILATITIISLEIPAAMISFSPILTGTNQVDFYCKASDDNYNVTILNQTEMCSGTEEICGNNSMFISEFPYISIVQEWDLYCDRAWITDTITSVQMFGAMLGPIATASVADRYGRKQAFYIICTLMGISGILSYYAQSLVTYGIARFVAGFAAGGGLVAHMNYLMEYLTPSWRVICGCVTFWPLGEILLGVFGYFIPSWRDLTLITSLPAFLLLFSIPYLHESPRWLLCHNKTAEATTVLNSIADWNKRPRLSPDTITKLQLSISKTNADDTKKDINGNGTTLWDKRILTSIGILSVAWFTNALIYLGISFNMKNMSGNRYLNVALLGVVDFPAEISGIYFSNRYGRKITFITTLAMGSMILAALAALQLTVSSNDGTLILALCLIGKFCIEASWATMACLTGEVFPTVIRSVCFSICSTFSSVGGIIAPQMALLGRAWAPGPYIIFCTLSIVSCIASLRLTEMKGKRLQDISADVGIEENVMTESNFQQMAT